MNVHLNLFKHVLRRSLRSIWENLYLNTVAAGVITASLLLLGVYTAGIINLNSIVDTWNAWVRVRIGAKVRGRTRARASTRARLELELELELGLALALAFHC